MRLFNRYFTSYDLLLVTGDCLIAIGSSLAVRGIFAWVQSSPTNWDGAVLHGIAMAVIVVIAFYYSNLYVVDQTFSRSERVQRFIVGLCTACVVIGLISYPIPNLGKPIYIGEMLTLGGLLALWRRAFWSLIQQSGVHGKILIIGTRHIGQMVAEQLYLRRTLGMNVVGFVSETAGKLSLAYGNPKRVELPIFAPQSLAGLVMMERINRILLAGSPGELPSCYNKELVKVRTMGVPVEDCHSFYERLLSKIAITDLPPEWIALSEGFRRDKIILASKRTIDVVMSFLCLIFSVPITLIAAIAIKLESRGPILYRQERVGENEMRFTLLKFRSMTANAEDSIGPVWARENDPRVTRIGWIIRKLRIDEIPQMINVLKGEMSFVGPRPERPFFVEHLKQAVPYYDLRHTVKPGITGWAQISYGYGDSERDAIEKLQYDLYYIKHMSPVFDLQIIFESLKVVIFGSGAR